MARYRGKDGDVEFGGTSVGERISFDLNITPAEADASTMGNNWSDVEALQLSAEGSLEVFYDPGDSAISGIVAGSTVTAVFYPGGNTSTLESFSGDWLITGESISTSVGDLVKRTYSIKNKGTITRAAIT